MQLVLDCPLCLPRRKINAKIVRRRVTSASNSPDSVVSCCKCRTCYFTSLDTWAAVEVTGHCLQSKTSTSVFQSLTHNPKCKLKIEVKPVQCKGKRLTGFPFTWQSLAPLIHGSWQLKIPITSVEKTWNQLPTAYLKVNFMFHYKN